MGLNENNRAPAVRRAAAVLDLIANDAHATWADVSRELQLARSSTSDLISTMLGEALIERRADRLATGSGWLDYAAGFTDGKPVLEQFVHEWERTPLLHAYTVSVQALVGDQSMCLETRMGREVLAVTPRVGSRYPAWVNGRAEPIMRRLAVKSIENSINGFRSFSGMTPETSAEILAWVRSHTTVDEAIAPVETASQGNCEMTVQILTVPDATIPLAVTLHLASGFVDESISAELSDALHNLAHRLGS